jgi:uncharacterized Zn finger protein
VPFGWKPYVSAAARRRRAAQAVSRFAIRGRHLSPVAIDGRAIARTFWGKAWCDNLERYSDYDNRLPRGRTYVRNGSVVDLQVAAGRVEALVNGSTLYRVEVKVTPVPQGRWRHICAGCAGEIGSLIELLQGRMSERVMATMCQEKTGLFPAPAEIAFTCSCPDWASMCKHVAAVLYGIGARLDHQPDLLFLLRQVDQQDLIAAGGKDLQTRRSAPGSARLLTSDDLSGLFGIEIDTTPAVDTPAAGGRARKRKKPAAARAKGRTTAGAPAEAHTKTDRGPQDARPRTRSAADRQSVSKRMKEYWAARLTRGKA